LLSPPFGASKRDIRHGAAPGLARPANGPHVGNTARQCARGGEAPGRPVKPRQRLPAAQGGGALGRRLDLKRYLVRADTIDGETGAPCSLLADLARPLGARLHRLLG
jgi:hypothetical protein